MNSFDYGYNNYGYNNYGYYSIYDYDNSIYIPSYNSGSNYGYDPPLYATM